MRYKRVFRKERERKNIHTGEKIHATVRRKTEMEEEGETRNEEHVSFPRGPVRARALGSPSPSTRHSYPPGDHRRGLTAPGRGACVTLVMRHTSHSFCRAVRAHVRRRVLRSLLSSFGLRSRSRVSERCKILRANRSLAE